MLIKVFFVLWFNKFLRDTRFVKPPIFTLCVGNAWGEAALLLAAGTKGHRAALPSSRIMIRRVQYLSGFFVIFSYFFLGGLLDMFYHMISISSDWQHAAQCQEEDTDSVRKIVRDTNFELVRKLLT